MPANPNSSSIGQRDTDLAPVSQLDRQARIGRASIEVVTPPRFELVCMRLDHPRDLHQLAPIVFRADLAGVGTLLRQG